MNNQPISTSGNLAKTAFLSVVFAMPWSDGNAAQILTISFVFILFSLSVLWFYRQYPVSILAYVKTQHSPAYYLFFAWLISSSISLGLVLFSDTGLLHKGIAAYRHIALLLLIVYVFALARFCVINRLSHIRIFVVLSAGVIALIALYLLTYHLGPTPNPRIWALYPPLGSHARNIGNVAAVCCVVSVLLFVNHIYKTRLQQMAVLFTALSIWSFLVWNGGRSSMAASVITSIIIMLSSVWFAKACIKRVIIISLVIIAGFFIGDQLSVFHWNGIQRAININAQAEQASTSSNTNIITNDKLNSGRTTMWRISLNAFKQSPWFGLGPYGYYFIPNKTDDDQPHNFIIQFLVEWGVIGTSLMLSLMLYCAWVGLKALPQAFKERDFSYISGGAVIFLLTLDGLTAGTYFKLLPMLCITTAFAVFPFGRRNTLSIKTPEN